jgi:hypothetical protein
MNREPWNWTKEDLENLIGQSESLRLEFKSSDLLNPNAKGNSPTKIADDLSKEASALANTEGGTIVIGIKERKEGRARIAEKIDNGVPTSDWSPERLQAVVESNLSPHLTGIRLRTIYLDAARTHCSFVISIPQGTTAYQASDRKYYGRSEYEAKALVDHEIRLRMFRGKVGNAVIFIGNLSKRTLGFTNSTNFHPDRFFSNITEAVARLPKTRLDIVEWDEADPQENTTKVSVDNYTFNVYLKNIGEINIREFKATMRISSEEGFLGNEKSETVKDGWVIPPLFAARNSAPNLMRVNIYPNDVYEVDTRDIYLLSSTDLNQFKVELHWTIYLSDRLPLNGIIDLCEAFHALVE